MKYECGDGTFAETDRQVTQCAVWLFKENDDVVENQALSLLSLPPVPYICVHLICTTTRIVTARRFVKMI